jgi:hypothetical protein
MQLNLCVVTHAQEQLPVKYSSAKWAQGLIMSIAVLHQDCFKPWANSSKTKAFHPTSQLKPGETPSVLLFPQLPQTAKSISIIKPSPETPWFLKEPQKWVQREPEALGYDESDCVFWRIKVPYCPGGLVFLCKHRIATSLHTTNMKLKRW